MAPKDLPQNLSWSGRAAAYDMTQSENKATRVVLADDHARVRAGIRTLLENVNDIEVVGEAGNGAEAIDLVEKLNPDVLLLDMEMPIMNGNQVARKLKERDSQVRILALSAYDDREYILGMLNNGASGYLTKEEAPEILVRAIRSIAQGENGWISRRVASKIASMRPAPGIDRSTITFREREVLKLLVARKTTAEITRQLGISKATLEKHIEILCSKLKAETRLDLIIRAMQERLDQ